MASSTETDAPCRSRCRAAVGLGRRWGWSDKYRWDKPRKARRVGGGEVMKRCMIELIGWVLPPSCVMSAPSARRVCGARTSFSFFASARASKTAAMLIDAECQPGPAASVGDDTDGGGRQRPAAAGERAERRQELREEQGRSQEMAPAKGYDVGGLTADSAPGGPEDAPRSVGGLAYTPTNPFDALPTASIPTKMPSGTGVVDAFKSLSITLFS